MLKPRSPKTCELKYREYAVYFYYYLSQIKTSLRTESSAGFSSLEDSLYTWAAHEQYSVSSAENLIY